MTELTQERLKKLYRYVPETGDFFTNSGLKDGPIGSLCDLGYLVIFVRLSDHDSKRKKYYAHQLAWLYVYGEFAPRQIDHINGVRSDTRIKNLRLATQSQNNANAKVQKRSATGTKGVTISRAKSIRYKASIFPNGESIHLGCFDTLDEAAHAYNKAAIHYYGEYACLNPIGVDK